MLNVISAVIKNSDGDLLVVDKLKENKEPVTILPGGSQEPGESDIQTLEREIEEELGITSIKVIKKIGEVLGISPIKKLETNISLYEVEIGNEDFITKREIENPRYENIDDLLEMGTVKELSRKALLKIIEVSTI